jgi:16S rRNA (cytidine1402-2'-O)-methyltransferase
VLAVSIRPGTLYVVATPIGNLEDISQRALRVLAEVAVVAAEDTRHTARLLAHYGVGTRLVSLHEHNQRQASPWLVHRLLAGECVAYVTDAGTPLLSDPGLHLVRAARAAGVRVSPVPGPSALAAALSVAGASAERFVFEGFLPVRGESRRERLRALAADARTVVLFEAPHRIAATLSDLRAACGADRRAVLLRELTKVFEESRAGSLAELEAGLAAGEARGEYVLVLEGAPARLPGEPSAEDRRVLEVLLQELPAARAAALAARLTGKPRGELYRIAMALSGKG